MAQKITGYVKLQIPAGKATPAPPVGPALGQHGINIAAFTKEFNERTKNDMGLIIPVVITVYADRSFSFITKTPPAAVLIKKECNIESGSGVPNKEKVATISKASIQKIAELKMNQMRISNRLEELKPQADAAQVTEKDLAQVIEVWTGIPASKIEATEFEKIRSLPEILSARVIGQEEAIKAVSAAIRRSRIHLSKRIRPASFIFVGPTGVGKTELVKVLGETLFDENEPLIRVDMSEYMEKHSVSKLIGSPPGYVGFDEAGQLTEKVRRRPYSVVLFDEIEKAHPDVMNILLQILDEGQIHDSQGRPVSFQNTVIVMTSNAGSTDRDTGVGFNKTQAEISKDKAMKALGEFLRPEFLGRVDEVVVFNPLTEEDYGKIAALMLDEMREPLEEQGISLAYKPAATALIAKKAYGKKLGGRDIRKVIREEVEDPLAEIMVEKGESGIKLVLVDAQDDKLIVKAE